MDRPARKQVDKPFLREFAYKQGDDEYNIWFDKYLNDKPVKEREPAATRCDPEEDTGYTKADKYEPETSFWCLHFIRGCCTEGVNCKFFHHLPSISECERIPPIKDIFGRTRHAQHREDMGGIGCFQKECRTIVVCDIKLPPSENPAEEVNEMLWRHFSIWGKVVDITFIPSKCIAFIKYPHRCYAEIAKEAMERQSLDYDEMLNIKWANDDPNPERENMYSEAWHKAQIEKANKKNRNPKTKEGRDSNVEEIKDTREAKKKKRKTRDSDPRATQANYELPKKLPPPVDADELEKSIKEDEKASKRMKKLEGILDKIDSEQPNTLAEIIFPANLDLFK